MPGIFPLLSCWRIEADALPEDMQTDDTPGGFSLPGAAALADFADLLGGAGDAPYAEAAAARPSAPFPLPALIPEAVEGEAALCCEIDFGALGGDRAVLTIDHFAGRGCVMLGDMRLAAFDSTSSSYKPVSEAFDLTAAPCMLAVDLTDALRLGRKETLSIRFDSARPAGVCGPVALRVMRRGSLSRVSVSPNAAQQTLTLRAQINPLLPGIFTLRAQPVSAHGAPDAARECAWRCEKDAPLEAEMTFAFSAERFAAGTPYRPGAVKISLLHQQEGAKRAVLCDSVTLLCGYPGRAIGYALPLTAQECVQEPQQLLARLSDLHIPAVRLPQPAPDALYRALTRAGIAARMADNSPLRNRLERLPCISFAAERVGEYAAVSPEASAWQMCSMVQTPRAVDPALSPAELLKEATGRALDPAGETIRGVLSWLRAVSVRQRAEAARQGRFFGALCAPGEWDAPDIAQSLCTAFAPLHVSALPLCGAWWSSSRFSAAIHAFIPSGAYTSDDPLIALAVLEDEDGNEIAQLRAPCRSSGGYVGVLEAQLPDHACVLTLTTRLTLRGDVLEESAMPVYIGERGPLEAAFG